MAEHIDGYEVTRDGRVFSTGSNWRGYGRRELVQRLDPFGYPSVRLTIDGRRKRYAVHRLVAATHLDSKPSDGHEVRHLDGDKLNNNASNLCWGTAKENADDRKRHGRTSSGERHSLAIKRGIQQSSNPYWRHAR